MLTGKSFSRKTGSRQPLSRRRILRFSRRKKVWFFEMIALISPTTTSHNVALVWNTSFRGTSKLEMRLDAKQVLEKEGLDGRMYRVWDSYTLQHM